MMWEIDLRAQIFTFLLSLLLGGAFCLVYDLFQIFYSGKNKLLNAVADISYFIIIAFVNFCFLLVASNGEMRLYLVFGEIMGFLICKKTVSRVFSFLLLLAIGCVKKTFRVIDKLIFTPFSKFFANTSVFCLKIGKKTLKFVKKGLKKPKDIVYTKEKSLDVGKGKGTANEHSC